MVAGVKEIVLASTSPYRRELLARLGLPFVTASPSFDEQKASGEVSDEQARALALTNARGKAESLAASHAGALILASDQVCYCQGRVLSKAGTKEKAIEQLSFLAGRTHALHTAVVAYGVDSNETAEELVTSSPTLRSLQESQIRHYVDTEEPLDSAGSYYSESLGVALFEKLETSDPTAIIGLPLTSVTRLLSHFGVDVLNPNTWPGASS